MRGECKDVKLPGRAFALFPRLYSAHADVVFLFACFFFLCCMSCHQDTHVQSCNTDTCKWVNEYSEAIKREPMVKKIHPSTLERAHRSGLRCVYSLRAKTGTVAGPCQGCQGCQGCRSAEHCCRTTQKVLVEGFGVCWSGSQGTIRRRQGRSVLGLSSSCLKKKKTISRISKTELGFCPRSFSHETGKDS